MNITSDGIPVEGSDKLTPWDQVSPGAYVCDPAIDTLTVAYVRNNDMMEAREYARGVCLAAERESHTIHAIYIDTCDSTVPFSERTAGSALLHAISSGRVQRVLFWHHDHLCDPEELMNLMALAKQHNVQGLFMTSNRPSPGPNQFADEIAPGVRK